MNSQNCYDDYHKFKDAKNFNEINNFELDCEKYITKNIKTAHKLSIYFFNKRKHALASNYARIEIDLLKKMKSFGVSYEQAVFNLGSFLLRQGKYDEAIIFFSEIPNLNLPTNKTALAYRELSKCFNKKGEFYKSIEYANKAINLLQKPNDIYVLFNSLISASSTYDQIGTISATKKGLYLLKKADSLINKNEFRIYEKLLLNTSLGNSFSTLHRYHKKNFLNNKQVPKDYYFKKSKYYYHKNLNIGYQFNDSTALCRSYINLSDLYLSNKKDSALYFIKKSLTYNTNDNNVLFPYKTSVIYSNFSKFYQNKNQYNKAFPYIEKAIKLNFEVTDSERSFNPTENQLLKVDYKDDILNYLIDEITISIELFLETKKNKFLKKAIKSVDISNNLINVIIDYSSENSNKLFWRKKISEAYALGTKASYLLGDEKKMFYFMEKNKALLLLQDIKQNVAQTNLPKNIIDKRINIKKGILHLEDFINKQQKNDTYTKEKDSLFFLKKQFTTFNDSLKLVYPDHFNIKSDINILDLDAIKEKLNHDTFVISYISNKVGFKDKALFGLAISKHEEFAFEVEDYNDFIDEIKTYSNLIKSPFKTRKEINQFKKVSYSLYAKLFPYDNLKEAIQGKNLIIIPDVSFENIPFEALNTSQNNLTYLIENHTISYAYSFSFLEQNSTIERITKENFVAFAPVNFENKNLKSLAKTENEINSINTNITGALFTNGNATKDSFLKNTTDYNIIHLATHAKSSNNPEIYFTNDTLKLHELYTHKTNADLVTLSACETNLGEINQGEGVFSLARGFFYSGANSVVSSLWNVNDASTSFLMKNFYENLTRKQSKVDALNNAKRKYLKEHSLSEKSPYYWASFVLIGDTGKTFEYNYYLYFGITFILFVLILLFKKYFYRKQ